MKRKLFVTVAVCVFVLFASVVNAATQNIADDVHIKGKLTVDKATSITGETHVTNNLHTTGTLLVDGATTITGRLEASGLHYPTEDGTVGQMMRTDGAGNITFSTPNYHDKLHDLTDTLVHYTSDIDSMFFSGHEGGDTGNINPVALGALYTVLASSGPTSAPAFVALTDAYIADALTISDSGHVSGTAIDSGTVADARIASTICRDSELVTHASNITNHSGTANRTTYINGSGVVTELAHGTAGYWYGSNGATSAPSWKSQGAIAHDSLAGATTSTLHTAYVRHSLATAANDFLVASGSGVFVKKTLAQTLTILGKNQASGIPSLDGSSLVTQNPANATATPTASKIPIAGVDGDLNIGWLPYSTTVTIDDDANLVTGGAVADYIDGAMGGDYVRADGTSVYTGPQSFAYPILVSELTGPSGQVAVTTSTVTSGFAMEVANSDGVPGGVRAGQIRLMGGKSGGAFSPVVYYKLNETSGVSVADSSGNSLTGTLSGTQSWGTGKLNNCLVFITGANSISRADNALLSGTQISVAFWMKSSYSGTETWTAAKSQEYTVGLYGTSSKPYIRVYDSVSLGEQVWSGSGSAALNDNTWHHVVCTYNGAAASIYVDGVSVSVGEIASGSFVEMHDTSSALTLGSAASAVYIDDFRIYTTALTLSQAQALYNSGSGTETVSPSLPAGVGTWCLDLAAADAEVMYGTEDAGAVLTFTSNTGDVDALQLNANGTLKFNQYTAGIVQTDADGDVTAGTAAIGYLPTGVPASGATTTVPTSGQTYTFCETTQAYARKSGATFSGDVAISKNSPTLTMTADASGAATISMLPYTGSNAIISYGSTGGGVGLALASGKTGVGNVLLLSDSGNVTFKGGTVWTPTADSTSAFKATKADGATSVFELDTSNRKVVGYVGAFSSYLDTASTLYSASIQPHTASSNIVLATRAASKRIEFQNESAAVKGHFDLAAGDLVTSGSLILGRGASGSLVQGSTTRIDTSGNATFGTVTSSGNYVVTNTSGTGAPATTPAYGTIYENTSTGDVWRYNQTGGWVQIYTAP